MDEAPHLKTEILDKLEILFLLPFEKRLLPLKEALSQTEEGKELFEICSNLFSARLEKIFEKNEKFAKILQQKLLQTEELESFLSSFFQKDGKDAKYKEVLLLILGIACLDVFIQANCTGPHVHQSLKIQLDPEAERKLFSLMNADGELVYAKAQLLLYLYFAQQIFSKHFAHCKSIDWWRARALLVHQKTLSSQTENFKINIQKHFASAVSFVSSVQNTEEKDELASRVHLEQALLFNYFHDSAQSKESLEQAQKSTGLSINLTGAWGKRTKFQTFETPQLILEATSKNENTDAEMKNVPREVANEDPDLLQKPTITNAPEQSSLTTIDQCLLLALCLDIKNNNPKHGLTTEQMFPYVRRVESRPNNWLIHSMCLLIKCRLEEGSTKTIERSALQLQALVDQYGDADGSSERLTYYFQLPFPFTWELKRELGVRFMALGVLRSSLQLFEELEIWDEIIKCYLLLDKKEKAKEIVQERLSTNPTAELWCILGDLTEDDELYEKAWEVSGHHFTRAKRSLGSSMFKKQKYKECLENYETALKINPLYPTSWFMAGCAAMRLTEWKKAANCFLRVVQQEPEDGESWNNLAGCYLKQELKAEALHAFTFALKFKRENWRIWENFMHLSFELEETQQAIYAFHQLLDLRGKEIDVQFLAFMTKVVLDENKPEEKKKLGELLGHVTSKIATNPDIWQAYHDYYASIGDKEKAMDARLKQVRCCQNAVGWEKEPPKFEKLAKAGILLVEEYLAEGSEKSFYSAQMFLNGVLKKAEELFASHTLFKKLQELAAVVAEKSKK
eukprot:TRINITY_DN6089_c0_g4_i1.p1 TRINITY_DN6089_c0_g4~~TRINITY_DN6089_c0_g4_i1.p1  ORF type:complete len:794 (-),score=249.56 TRINITY_DN6089_c0_g4_i1:18-2399(-)